MNRKTILTYAAFAVCTLAFALASTWPFFNAWRLRYSPAYLASVGWVTESPSVAALVGDVRYTENDTFPKGGARDGVARFEHRLVGNKQKAKIAVILEDHGGAWTVSRAAYETDDGWTEIAIP